MGNSIALTVRYVHGVGSEQFTLVLPNQLLTLRTRQKQDPNLVPAGHGFNYIHVLRTRIQSDNQAALDGCQTYQLRHFLFL